MPTYDYRCKECDHRFETFQSMKDAPKRKCPECGKNALERLIGVGAGIIFKGSGFYETDYRSDSYKKAAEAEKKSASGDASSAADSKGASASGKPDKPAKASKAEQNAADSSPKAACGRGVNCGCAKPSSN